MLNTPSGHLSLSHTNMPQPVSVGQTATLTVLDTKTNLAMTPPSGRVNVMPVRMIGEEFIGATATIYLETGDGQEIRVQKSHEDLASLPLEIGQELVAYWSHEDGHLVMGE
jgi:spermidine/putrescine transport system ATP-binding protein